MSHVEPRPGDVVGKYVVEAVLGRGGMGAVYRARHQITDRRVALKWLLEDDPSRRRRFLREAKAMGRLSHPNVVGVLDVGDHEGAIFLVMDFVEGESLREHMAERPLPPAEAVQVMLPAMSGVAAAHQAGILHRDLKPENLFVCKDRDGSAFDTKVLDFGVAKALYDEGATASLTHSGAIVGTPKYMAPEQLGEEQDLDARCDVYALGLITFELLTGRLPYRSTTLNKLFLEILTAELPRASEVNSDVPVALAEVVQRALARDPADRWPDVHAFAAALEPFADGARFQAPRSVHTPDATVRAAAASPVPLASEAPTSDEAGPAKPRVQTGDRRTDPAAETVAAPASLASSVDRAVPPEPASHRPRWWGWAAGATAVAAVGAGVLLTRPEAVPSPAESNRAPESALALEPSESALPQQALPPGSLPAPGPAADSAPPEPGLAASNAEPSRPYPSAPESPLPEPPAPESPAAETPRAVAETPRAGPASSGARPSRARQRRGHAAPAPAAAPDEPSPVRVQMRGGVISADDF